MMSDTKSWRPPYTRPPGETLQEVLDALGLTQADLAARTGRPKKTINEIVKGKTAITPETALQFEKVLAVPASVWNRLEQDYRANLAREQERERLRGQLHWLKEMPVRALKKMKWIPSAADPIDQLEALLSFYGVASVDAWHDVWSDLQPTASFRKAHSFETDFATATAWLRRGELEAREVETSPFDPEKFRLALNDARTLTFEEDPEVFTSQLIGMCSVAGVAVCFVPEIPKLRVCGATQWLGPDKALIQLSLRYKSHDQIWFTFFHEAGHILLHGKRSIFVEEKGGGGARAFRGGTEPQKEVEQEEEEANRFAQDILIPPDEYEHFVSASQTSAIAIQDFAAAIGIHRSIVLGRLQRDGLIPWASPLNTTFKPRYKFV